MCRQQMKATCGVPAHTGIYFIRFKIFCPETTLTAIVFPQHCHDSNKNRNKTV